MKNLQLKLILVICLAGMIGVGYGQQNPVMTHYLVNPYLYNTAAVGQKGTVINMHYRKQWIDMPDAPDTKIFTAQGMFKDKFGLGAKVYMDKAHIIQNYAVKVSYAYYVRTKKDPDNHYVSIGISAGFKHQRLNFEEANIESDVDPNIFFNGASKSVFDADAGINYFMKGFRLGLSIANLAPNTYNFSSNTSSLEFKPVYHIYGNAAYDIKLGKDKDLTLQPSVLLRVIPNIPTQIDANVMFDYKNIFWVSTGYRLQNTGIFGLAGFRIHDMVAVNYSYEQSVDGFQAALGSTHEFSVEIRLNKKKGSNDSNDNSNTEYANLTEEQLEWIDSLNTYQADSAYTMENAAQEEQNRIDLDNKLASLVTANANGGEKIYEALDLAGTVSFAINASNIYSSHRAELDAIYNEVVGGIESGDIVMVLLTGSASIEGNEDFNLILSNKRTEKVRQYLIDKGVPEDLIVTTFKGNTVALVREQLNVKGDDDVPPEADRIVQVHVLR